MKLNYIEIYPGNKETVIMLHGLASSSRYWESISNFLPKDKRYIFIDLLGFGLSPMPNKATYDYDTQINCILETLKTLNVSGPFTLIGHSMGALIGLRIVATNPQLVSKLILFGMAYYPTSIIARSEITRSTKIRKYIYYGPSSHALCFMWCTFLRPITKQLAPIYLSSLPKKVAQDSLLHTWKSFSESLLYIIEQQDAINDLKKIGLETVLLYGSRDRSLKYFKEVNLRDHPNIKLKVYSGYGHQLPLDNPTILKEVI